MHFCSARATRIEFPAKNVLILNVLKGLLSLIRQIEYLFQWRQRKRCKCILDIFMDEGQTMESYLWCSFSHFIWEKKRRRTTQIWESSKFLTHFCCFHKLSSRHHNSFQMHVMRCWPFLRSASWFCVLSLPPFTLWCRTLRTLFMAK